MPNINENVATNIIALRKERKWTQQELAEKLNYSDKTVSKWERGESTPDIEMLDKLSKVFNVNIEFLVKEHTQKELSSCQNTRSLYIRDYLILSFICLAIFFISMVIFVFQTLIDHANASKFWVAFVFAVPLCSLVFNFYAMKIKHWIMAAITSSIFIWTIIASLFCVAIVLGYYSLWMLFLVGLPIQAAICLFFFYKRRF